MKIKILLLTFALALTVWAQTETKNAIPAPDKKSAAAKETSCCKGGKCSDSKDGKMKCDMAAHKEAKGGCAGKNDKAEMKGMDHMKDMGDMQQMGDMQNMPDMKDMKGEHGKMSCGGGMKGDSKAMSCCGGMKAGNGKMKCDMAAPKDAKNSNSAAETKEATGCCGDKCPMHGEHADHAAHAGN